MSVEAVDKDDVDKSRARGCMNLGEAKALDSVGELTSGSLQIVSRTRTSDENAISPSY